MVRDSGSLRQVSLAAQNAGVPASVWSPGNAAFDAAGAAGAAALAARQAQGGRGVLSPGAEVAQPGWSAPSGAFGGEQVDMNAFAANVARDAAIQQTVGDVGAMGFQSSGGYSEGISPEAMAFAQGQAAPLVDTRPMGRPAGSLPATSDPGAQEFWDRADMRQWARANKGLAENLVQRKGYRPPNWNEIMGNKPTELPRPQPMEFPGAYQQGRELTPEAQALMSGNQPAMANVAGTTYPGAFDANPADLERLKNQLITGAKQSNGSQRFVDLEPQSYPGAFAAGQGLSPEAQAMAAGQQPAMAAPPTQIAPAGAFELQQGYLDQIKQAMGGRVPQSAPATQAEPANRFAPETDLSDRLQRYSQQRPLVPGMGSFSVAGAY
jgi:hypothetical protein